MNLYLCLDSDVILQGERALYLLLALATKYLATSGRIMYQVHHHHHHHRHRHRHRHDHGYGSIINTINIINIVAFTTTTTTTTTTIIIIILIIILIIISFDKAGYITCRR